MMPKATAVLDAARVTWVTLAVLLVLSSSPRAYAEPPCILRVATTGDYAPFSLTTATGDREGLDIDIVRRLGTDLGCTVQLLSFKWPELHAQLETGAVDLVASGITMRPERAVIGRFSRPYAITGALALIRATDADRFKAPADLNQPGVRIAVNAGGHLERVARVLLPQAKIRPQHDNRALPQALRNGSADAVMSDSAEARAWLSDDLRVVGPFTHDYKALLLPAGAGDLAARINTWLQAREDDGWLGAQRTRYLGAAAATDAARAGREAVAALIRLRLELMPAVGAAKRHAGLPIEDKTQERRVLVRVAAQAPAHPVRLANVYGQLIALAKAVQNAHATEKPSANLEVLRDAIGRIDDLLVREIDRPHSATQEEWQAVIDETVTIEGVDDPMRVDLTHALAGMQ